MHLAPKFGEKRRFLAFGLLNISATNSVLQLLLVFKVSTGLATLLSQLINVGLGYMIYGTKVFRVKRLDQRSALAYGGLSLLLWWGNWAGISFLVQLGWSRPLAAVVLIPLLAACSYLTQKLLVFAPRRQP